MADRDQERAVDPKVSAAYRALGAEEPPRALDDAILAAARRAAGARPGSPGRTAPQRWVASFAAAAVLVLAVAVTLHMQIEQPDVAQPLPAAKQPATPIPSAPSAAPAEAESKVPVETEAKSAARERRGVGNEAVNEQVKPAKPKAAELSRSSEPEPFPARADRAADIPRAPAAPQAEERASRDAVASARAPAAGPAQAQALARGAAAQGNLQADTPQRELERIAELRRQGRHDEADKALAEFRKRYPAFRIPEEMRARVERR
jgi:hypothetical protein